MRAFGVRQLRELIEAGRIAWPSDATQLKVKPQIPSMADALMYAYPSMYPEKETTSFLDLPSKVRGSDMAKPVCRCCGEARASVENRNLQPISRRPSGVPVWMCEECWMDPAILKADCRHGAEAATADERIRERLRQVW